MLTYCVSRALISHACMISLMLIILNGTFFSGSSGAVEHGTHYQLKLAYEHNLQRTAFNFCSGPFGGVKGQFLTVLPPYFSLSSNPFSQGEISSAFSPWMAQCQYLNKRALPSLGSSRMRCCPVPYDMCLEQTALSPFHPVDALKATSERPRLLSYA